MKLGEMAERLEAKLRGDANIEISSVGPIEAADEGQITFVANARYLKHLATTRASAVIVAADVLTERPCLVSDNPYLTFARAIELFYQPIEGWPGIHPTAAISPSAAIGPGSSIGPYCVIGDGVRIGSEAKLGPHVVIYPETTIGDSFVAHAHVTIRERVRIGRGVILHAGSVIGSDGFGYVPTTRGIQKIVQAGDVILEDGVEIGANATVDRATVGSTIVRRMAKLDNLVMVAHGCEIGEGSLLAAQVGVAGSTRVGRWVQMGGQAGIAGHLTIGDGVQLAAKTGVANSVPAGKILGGSPAAEASVWRRVTAALPRLPGLFRRVRRLERLLGLTPEEGGD